MSWDRTVTVLSRSTDVDLAYLYLDIIKMMSRVCLVLWCSGAWVINNHVVIWTSFQMSRVGIGFYWSWTHNPSIIRYLAMKMAKVTSNYTGPGHLFRCPGIELLLSLF